MVINDVVVSFNEVVSPFVTTEVVVFDTLPVEVVTDSVETVVPSKDVVTSLVSICVVFSGS